MSRILITGSAQGLGRAAASQLLAEGHEVTVHVRSQDRVSAVADLRDRGARVLVADLANRGQTLELAEQVNQQGRMNAIIHNAGVISGAQVMEVNVVAPYLLTALIHRPERLIYLSSSMHHGGHPDPGLLSPDERGSYSDSKLFVTALSAAVARLWADVYSNAVDPGWVPTRMGGPGASDDLDQGHVTQAWLAASKEPAALTSGGYWHHLHRFQPHSAVNDPSFQRALLDRLAGVTGVVLPVNASD